MWLSECTHLLCVCQEPQTARRKAVCAGATHTFMPAFTHPRTRQQKRLFQYYSVLTENLSKAQQEGRKNSPSDHPTGKKAARHSAIYEREDAERKACAGCSHSPPSPFSSSDLEEASSPKVTPRRSVHILGLAMAAWRLRVKVCEISPVVNLPRVWRSVCVCVCLSVSAKQERERMNG